MLDTTVNDLFQTSQQSIHINLIDIVVMILVSIFSVFSTVGSFLWGVFKVGFKGLNDREFNAKHFFLITITPFAYMFVSITIYNISHMIITAIFSDSLDSNLNIFNFNADDYDLSHFNSQHIDFKSYLIGIITALKNTMLTMGVAVYSLIYVFYFSEALSAIYQKRQLSIWFNIMNFFGISMIGVIVANTFDIGASSLLFKDNPVELHGYTSHTISEFLSNEVRYYAKKGLEMVQLN